MGDCKGGTGAGMPCRGGAWIMDLDTIWTRSLPSVPSLSGHAFASMRAEPPRGKDRIRFWKINGLAQPGDQRWCAFPGFFPTASTLLKRLLAGPLRDILDPTLSRTSYLYVMQSVRAAIQAEVARTHMTNYSFMTSDEYFGKPEHRFKSMDESEWRNRD